MIIFLTAVKILASEVMVVAGISEWRARTAGRAIPTDVYDRLAIWIDCVMRRATTTTDISRRRASTIHCAMR